MTGQVAHRHMQGVRTAFYRIGVVRVVTVGALLGLIVVAFLIRTWGARFGLPEYVYHPDEGAVVEHAAAILRSGDFNPGWFHYPSGYIYIQLLSQVLYLLLGAMRGNIGLVPQHTLPQFYLAGRWTTALFGTAIVPVAYLMGRKAFSRRVGLVASGLVAFSYLNVVHSHYATTDIPASLMVALCTLFSILILQRGDTLWYVLAGLMAGFSTGMKYNAGLVVLLLPLAHILRSKAGEWLWIDRRIVAGLLAAGGGFLLTTPNALFDLPTFLNGLLFELYHYHDIQPAYTGESGLWYLRVALTSADAPVVVCQICGLGYTLARPSRTKLLLLSVPVLYFVGLATTPVHFERNLLPILPVFCVLAAAFLADASGWLADRLGLRPGWPRLVALAAITCSAIVLPLTAALLYDGSINHSDIRGDAGRWVSQNVPRGSRIAIEHYSIPFPSDQYQVTDIMRVWDHEAAWYAQQGFDYVIVSSGVWLTMADDPQRHQQELAILRDLQTNYQLVAEFHAQVPRVVVAGYPTIRDYHFPTVWIVRVRSSNKSSLSELEPTDPRRCCLARPAFALAK